MLRLLLISILFGLSVGSSAAEEHSPSHPLDPLSWKEHWAVLKILASADRMDDDTDFTRVAVKPPSKEVVWAWPDGPVPARQAEVILSQDGDVAKVVVDIDAGKIISWTEVDGQLTWLQYEDDAADIVDIVQSDERFLEAMKARGIEHLQFVSCSAVPYVNFAIEDYEDRRVGVVKCDYLPDARNTWPRGIPGMDILVDLDEDLILEFRDEEAVGPAAPSADFRPSSQNVKDRFPTPINIEQPLGPSFAMEGHVVNWDKWRFHWRGDQKVGLIISTVSWNDGDVTRPVMFEGHLSELFVPYMSPDANYYSATYYDVGDYSAGGLADSMVPGLHCPMSATFLDMIVTGDDGQPEDVRRAGCLFERSSGDVEWSYADYAVPKRELVARYLAQMGNYDYIIDWVFQTDGEIRVVVGATGIMQSRAVTAKSAADPSADDRYGRFVDQNILAVNHSHYFSFRFDLDVDGLENRFVKDQLRREELPEGSRRDAVWVVDSQVVETEEKAKVVMRRDTPAMLRFAHAEKKNKHGYSTSYRLVPGHTARTLLDENDVTRKRAGFISHDLWVTPYAENERYAAGEFTTLAPPGEDGLPAWTENNRSILDQDIVAWSTIGMHHVPRAEDWPVMPTLQHYISLMPFDFFDSNPTAPPTD
ncbi:MAG: primary-amine oxidase [Candidatus Azotimanducaceae bacterium]